METATELQQRFADVRAHTERLAAPLSPEDQTVQSMPDVSPTKWHRAHVTWFFETFLLADHEPNFRPFQDQYWFLFNSYYESVGPRYDRPMRGVISRPGAHDVGLYRDNVDARFGDLIDRLDDGMLGKLRPLIELGFNHEQQHQELLLMDIKHVLSLNPLQPVYGGTAPDPTQPDRMGWVDFDGGLVEIGHDGSAAGGPLQAGGAPRFCFDNELPRHPEWLAPYRLADRLVTNVEWLEFMADGGYQRPELWLSDGWARVKAEGWRAPLYWRNADGEGDDGVWLEHTLHGTFPVNLGLPVCHVSHYEADAFATWAGHRLPTESEWEHAASLQSSPSTIPSGTVTHPLRSREVPPEQTSLHPLAAGPAGAGLRQLLGDCWEWTSSAYLPYPGFHPAAGAVGEYNGKFMSNQMVLRGGCALTPPGHARIPYRNFFPPGARWPMTGVRLAQGEAA
jgi:ergothioneine biosynthesis protein EgtB